MTHFSAFGFAMVASATTFSRSPSVIFESVILLWRPALFPGFDPRPLLLITLDALALICCRYRCLAPVFRRLALACRSCGPRLFRYLCRVGGISISYHLLLAFCDCASNCCRIEGRIMHCILQPLAPATKPRYDVWDTMPSCSASRGRGKRVRHVSTSIC